nr:unnamed protein product [Digitaria exilis]
MAGPRPLLRRILRLAAAFAVASCACFPAPVSGIRQCRKSPVDEHVGLEEERKDIGFIEPIVCRSTVQGRHLISDDNGNTSSFVMYVLQFQSIHGHIAAQQKGTAFPASVGCKLDSQCCNSYEYCVSCCLNPSKTKKEDVLKLKVAKPVTAGTYTDVFDFCMGRCRHSSASVVLPFLPPLGVHENAYASDFHHCFSQKQNASGSTESSSVSKLLGINVLVGRPGESCSMVCKVRGQSCVPSRLSVLNKCEM